MLFVFTCQNFKLDFGILKTLKNRDYYTFTFLKVQAV